MADEPSSYIWVRRIGRNWVLNAQAFTGSVFYLGLFIALVGFFLPARWYVALAGLLIACTYPLAAGTERWLFFHCIKCPKCGFNATFGKTTGAPLNYAVAWSRLEQYVCCPRCGDEGGRA
jgi:hypothetical protein